ncbi:hypothetical protein ABT272_18845 [Streptomyces sp900105245]|uniref:Uncharacterized protein n=1 Tax=Streptomyces sp. 900105245 TaxID=3154379 RepID=A0ABV1U7S7_9ACTN
MTRTTRRPTTATAVGRADGSVPADEFRIDPASHQRQGAEGRDRDHPQRRAGQDR